MMTTVPGVANRLGVGEREAALRRIRRLSTLLDSAFTIPGTRWRIGLDPLIGLVPVAGDVITAAMSGYIIIEAHRIGAPFSVLLRMIGNVAIDFLIGEIPVLGDLFDFAWKSNVRNLRILERYLNQ